MVNNVDFDKYIEEIAASGGCGRSTYRIVTYGCQMNMRDSATIGAILGRMGFREASEGENADITIYNTCCVREHAEERVYGNVGALRQKKADNPDMIIGVCGCMMQKEGEAEELMSRFPFVDMVFGTHALTEFPSILWKALHGGRVSFTGDADGGLFNEDLPSERTAGPSAYVTVMQGCDNFCSYCIVPYVRGRERSRTPSDIMREISGLAADGVKEIVLLGQNVNSYGKGIDGPDFAGLLRMAAGAEGIDRIRFMTSHPKDLSDGLIEAVAGTAKVSDHIHLPVQSGSDRILRAMNRNYDGETYLSLVRKIHDAGCSVTTDIIVGFPGETEEDFEATLDLVRKARFHAAYMYAYSPREGTVAYSMPDHVPEDVKKRRLNRLIEVQNAITDEINHSYVGSTAYVMPDTVGKRDPGIVTGLQEHGRTVALRGGKELLGRIVPVKITEVRGNILFGECI